MLPKTCCEEHKKNKSFEDKNEFPWGVGRKVAFFKAIERVGHISKSCMKIIHRLEFSTHVYQQISSSVFFSLVLICFLIPFCAPSSLDSLPRKMQGFFYVHVTSVLDSDSEVLVS